MYLNSFQFFGIHCLNCTELSSFHRLRPFCSFERKRFVWSETLFRVWIRLHVSYNYLVDGVREFSLHINCFDSVNSIHCFLYRRKMNRAEYIVSTATARRHGCDWPPTGMVNAVVDQCAPQSHNTTRVYNLFRPSSFSYGAYSYIFSSSYRVVYFRPEKMTARPIPVNPTTYDRDYLTYAILHPHGSLFTTILQKHVVWIDLCVRVCMCVRACRRKCLLMKLCPDTEDG